MTLLFARPLESVTLDVPPILELDEADVFLKVKDLEANIADYQ